MNYSVNYIKNTEKMLYRPKYVELFMNKPRLYRSIFMDLYHHIGIHMTHEDINLGYVKLGCDADVYA